MSVCEQSAPSAPGVAEVPTRPVAFSRLVALWAGQVGSMIGSGMTTFALSVHVFQTTRSTSQYTFVELLWMLPAILLSPFAGAWSDRVGHKRIVLFADASAIVAPLFLAFRFRAGPVPISEIGVTAIWLSVCAAFQWPAFSALVAKLAPADQLSRANGMMEMGRAASQLVAPLAAGFLVANYSIDRVLLADASSLLLAVAALLALAPTVARSGLDGTAATPNESKIVDSVKSGLAYIRGQEGMLALLWYGAFLGLTLGMVEICLPPLILTFASPQRLGTILWVGGLGMVVGGILMSVWEGPRRPIRWLVVLPILQGALLLFGARSTRTGVWAAMAFAYLFAIPIVVTATQTLWLKRTPETMHGQVLGLRRALESSSYPLAAVVAGPLVDRLFSPLIGGTSAVSVALRGALGAAPDQGIAVLFTALGAATVLGSVVAYSSRALRALDVATPEHGHDPDVGLSDTPADVVLDALDATRARRTTEARTSG